MSPIGRRNSCFDTCASAENAVFARVEKKKGGERVDCEYGIFQESLSQKKKNGVFFSIS